MASQSEINDSNAPSGGRRLKSKRTNNEDKRLLTKVGGLIAYLVMLILVLIYFTGKGLFIYEGF